MTVTFSPNIFLDKKIEPLLRSYNYSFSNPQERFWLSILLEKCFVSSEKVFNINKFLTLDARRKMFTACSKIKSLNDARRNLLKLKPENESFLFMKLEEEKDLIMTKSGRQGDVYVERFIRIELLLTLIKKRGFNLLQYQDYIFRVICYQGISIGSVLFEALFLKAAAMVGKYNLGFEF